MDYDHFEMSEDARAAVFAEFASQHPIAAENIPFTPPADGSPWLKFDYMEASTDVLDLARRCMSFIGLVQLSVHFSPGVGVTTPRRIAKQIATFAQDGKIIGQGYVYTPGDVRPVQKAENGWFIPVRFSIRYDGRL